MLSAAKKLILMGGTFLPSRLFAAGEVGAWYDPSDLTTLFQDSAGTTPVTAAGEPVGLMRDKSGRGNHATGTLTTRPTYAIAPKTGRRNLLTYTEQFNNAAWVKTEATVLANSTTAPDGTVTADTISDTTATGGHSVYEAVSLTSGTTYTLSAYVKDKDLGFCALGLYDTATKYATFKLTTGVVEKTGGIVSSNITSVGSGWYRVSITITSSFTGTCYAYLYLLSSGNFAGYTGTGAGIYAWGAQIEASSSATAYQKVVSQYEVSEAGVPSLSCLSFDGIDDFMLTGTITPGTDKAQVFAGVRKFSDAAAKIVAELSATIASNNGAFRLAAPDSAAANYGFSSKGTTQTDAVGTTYTAPISNVLTGLGDISGDVTTLRVNGVQSAQSTSDQGTGNYLAYPLYIGRRGGSTLPFNGNLYGLIVRFGPNLTDGVIGQTETWMNQRTGAY